MDGIVERIDALQRRWRITAFLWSVQKKYSDDRGGYLAALITYYGFLSIFPLLLAASTVVAYAFSGNHSAAKTIQDHISSYPIVGEVSSSLGNGSLHGSAIALIVGVVGLVWGSQGLAQATQYAMDEVLNVSNRNRPGFFPRTLRGFGWYAIFGLGALIATFITSLGSALHWSGGPILSSLLSIVLDIGLFLVSFWILSPKGCAIKPLLHAAIGAGAAWGVLSGVGVGLTHKLSHVNPLYGSFAGVLGLLALIYLNARITLYCLEASNVFAHHLWPRSLTSDRLTDADKLQLKNLAEKEERIEPEDIDVEIEPEASRA